MGGSRIGGFPPPVSSPDARKLSSSSDNLPAGRLMISVRVFPTLMVKLTLPNTATGSELLGILRRDVNVNKVVTDMDNFFLHLNGSLMELNESFKALNVNSAKDKIEFKPAPKERKATIESIPVPDEASSIFVIIESPSHGMIKTFQFDLNTTVAQVIDALVEKHPVSNPSSYGLKYIMSTDRDILKENLVKYRQQRRTLQKQEGTWLVRQMSLANCNLKNMDWLLFKQITAVKSRPAVPMKKMQVFGVDPSKLPSVDYKGFKIPKVLAVLKKNLEEHRGIEEIGIFRLAGSESILKEIKSQLNTDTFKGSDEVHCLATLIKRWFGELPTRIFDKVSNDDINSSTETEEDALALSEQLEEPQKGLFQWLMDLLLDVAEKEELNRMTPNNLAIVLAPSLVNVSIDNPMQGLMLTKSATIILGLILASELKKRNGKKAAPPIAQAPPAPSETRDFPSGLALDQIFQQAIYQGYLYLETPGIIKDIRRVYCVLSGNFLYIFKSRQDSEPSESIPLAGSTVRGQTSPAIGGPKSFFELSTTHRKYTFNSDSSSELNEWLHFLHKRITRSQSYITEALAAPAVPSPPPALSAPAPTALTGAARSGWIQKKAGASWQKRFLVLKNITLSIHVSPDDPIPTDSIHLLACQAKEAKVDRKRAGFDVVTPKKTYNLSTESRVETEAWLESIRAAILDYVGDIKAYEAPSDQAVESVKSDLDAEWKKQQAVTNAPAKKDIRKERQRQIDQLMADQPKLLAYLLTDPHRQQSFQKQYQAFLESKGALTANGIVDSFLSAQKKQALLEAELQGSVADLMPLLTNDRMYGDFMKAWKEEDGKPVRDLVLDMKQMVAHSPR